MKTLLSFIFILLLVSCGAPYHIVETYTTDSTGKQVRTVHKYYDNTQTEVVPQASFNIYSSPFFYPYYRPVIVPRVVIPQTPRYYYRPSRPIRH